MLSPKKSKRKLNDLRAFIIAKKDILKDKDFTLYPGLFSRDTLLLNKKLSL